MCKSTKEWIALFSGNLEGFLNAQSYEKARKKDQAAINAANQAAQNQVEQNKLANSTQSTENTTKTDTTKKIATQKIPLNTASTGATIGSGTSVGLNLGGY